MWNMKFNFGTANLAICLCWLSSVFRLGGLVWNLLFFFGFLVLFSSSLFSWLFLFRSSSFASFRLEIYFNLNSTFIVILFSSNRKGQVSVRIKYLTQQLPNHDVNHYDDGFFRCSFWIHMDAGCCCIWIFICCSFIFNSFAYGCLLVDHWPLVFSPLIAMDDERDEHRSSH